MTVRAARSVLWFFAGGALLALAGCVGAPEAIATPPGYGSMCFAGVYSCQLAAPVPTGSQCTCPGIGAPSFGAVR